MMFCCFFHLDVGSFVGKNCMLLMSTFLIQQEKRKPQENKQFKQLEQLHMAGKHIWLSYGYDNSRRKCSIF